MKKNDCSTLELKEKIRRINGQKISKELELIYEKHFLANNIYFEKIEKDYILTDEYGHRATFYFFCNDGVLAFNGEEEDPYTKQHYVLKREIDRETYVVNKDHLDNIAQEFHKANKKAKILGEILEQDKIRGLFAKLKTSK